jgi:iron complex outermembrane receptor protein
MFKLNTRASAWSRAFALATGVASISIVAPVFAADDIAMEEVVVTGSRIKNSNMVSSSPVTQISGEELKFQGVVRVEDMMRTMPSMYTGQTSATANGSTGTATINLRNLGTARTLVLLNGRRLPAGSPLQGGAGADINQIPGALIQSVEVLTGGASATYGSDAVAGVVNFIMMNDFEGLKIDGQWSQYNHDNDNSRIQSIAKAQNFPAADGNSSNGDMSDVSFILGSNMDNGRGNITLYGTYRKIKAVLQDSRDYSSCALNGSVTTCGGSSTLPEGRFTDFANYDFIVAGDQFAPRAGLLYNYGPLNYFQRPDERYTFGAFGHYEVNDMVEVYTELNFMDDRTVSQIAPSGNFFATNTLNCSNPFLSAQQFQSICGDFGLTTADTADIYIARRNVEGGPRQQDLRHTSFRGVFGVRGELMPNWTYDAYGQYSEVSMENTYNNDLSNTKITRALNAVTDPATGSTVCQSVLDGSDGNCVPWNIFTTGAVTKAMTDYLVLPLYARGTTVQKVFSYYVNGDLTDYGVQIPGTNQGVSLVLGTEYRAEKLDFAPDSGFTNGEGAGQGGATNAVSGGYSVSEYFLEAQIPVVQGKEFAEEIVVDLGYRYSDYSTGVTTDTYGVRAGWAINSEVKLRASVQRAVRAANIRELFAAQGFNLFDMDADPCGGAIDANGQTAEGRTLAQCALSGVTAAQFGNIPNSPANQYNYLQGGNPNLNPEEADTYSAGVIWVPEMVAGLSLSVDYWDIKIEKGISAISPEFIINQCLDGNTAQCANVKRGNNGDLWLGSNVASSGQVVALNDNLAIERVKGWDIIADYSMEVGDYGSLQFNNVMAIIGTWEQQELQGAPADDCKGNWGATCGSPTPDFQNNLRTTWNTPWNVDASVLWRYISEVKDLNGNDITLDAVNYFDVTAAWQATESISLRAGINNLFDEEPPVAGGNAGPSNNGNGNVFPGTYDHLGRYWFTRASLTL